MHRLKMHLKEKNQVFNKSNSDEEGKFIKENEESNMIIYHIFLFYIILIKVIQHNKYNF